MSFSALQSYEVTYREKATYLYLVGLLTVSGVYTQAISLAICCIELQFVISNEGGRYRWSIKVITDDERVLPVD